MPKHRLQLYIKNSSTKCETAGLSFYWEISFSIIAVCCDKQKIYANNEFKIKFG